MFNWDVEQMDVITAFLNGEIDATIYIQFPEGYKEFFPLGCNALKLRKALYGTKQGSRCWYQTLKSKNVL